MEHFLSEIKSRQSFARMIVSQSVGSTLFVSAFENSCPSTQLVIVDDSGIFGNGVARVHVSVRDAAVHARALISNCGLLAGLSSGSVYAASQLHPSASENTVLVFDDSIRECHDTLLNEEWLIRMDLLGSKEDRELTLKYRGACVEDLQLPVCFEQGTMIFIRIGSCFRLRHAVYWRIA